MTVVEEIGESEVEGQKMMAEVHLMMSAAEVAEEVYRGLSVFAKGRPLLGDRGHLALRK